jgi:hypothetical protein
MKDNYLNFVKREGNFILRNISASIALVFFMIIIVTACDNEDINSVISIPVTTETSQLMPSTQPINANTTNNDFIGDWNRTNTVTGCAAEIRIKNQTAKSFSFSFLGLYGGNGGSIDGIATILDNNKAVFEYISEYDKEVFAKVEFVIENDILKVSVIDGFNYALGFGNKVYMDGEYTKSKPKYTNENIINEILPNEEIKNRMKVLLGEDAYIEMLNVIQDGARYDENDLDYSGFLDGCGQGVDLVIKGNKIYCLGYFIGEEGYILYTNDENYKDILPPFFHIDRTDYKLGFVYKP